MMMMMMIIITVPKSYVVSGLPLWCNKDDFTLTEPATCFRTFPGSYRLTRVQRAQLLRFRTFPGFLPPDSNLPGAAPFFLFSPLDPASWRLLFNYNCLVSVVSSVEPPELCPSQFSSYRSFPGFLNPGWRPSVAPFLFTFSPRIYCLTFVHILQLSSFYSFSAFLPRGFRP